MTTDHWIQIAAIVTGSITPFAVAIWGPVISSRVNQPNSPWCNGPDFGMAVCVV
jgi:hypothetical protein